MQVIHCRAGSRRSSHWHREDAHTLYVLHGTMHYYWRELGDDGRPHHVEVCPGQMVFTGPRVEHWCRFDHDATLICVSKRLRTKEEHEADLVRVPWHE